MKIRALYFSGTGNTAWVGKLLEKKLKEKNNDVMVMSIEDYTVEEVITIMQDVEMFGILYPAYGNDMPPLLREYLEKLSETLKFTKEVKAFSIVNAGMYAADGANAGRDIFEKMNAEIIGSYNIIMSCNFNTFIPGFRISSDGRKQKLLVKATKKMDEIIENLMTNTIKIESNGNLNRFFGKLEHDQNVKMMANYDVKINKDMCISCSKCVGLCPTNNLSIPEKGKSVETSGNCTICLRCINNCPVHAIRVLNKKGTRKFKQYKGPEI